MKIQLALVSLFVIFQVGCGGPAKVEIAEVTGTVTQNGEPLAEVKITFSPDPEKRDPETIGRPSHAITDADGKFRLKYSGDQAEFGAQIGWHRITALDFKAENSRDNPIPFRVARKYATAKGTNLNFEVKPGDSNEYDFELDPRS